MSRYIGVEYQVDKMGKPVYLVWQHMEILSLFSDLLLGLVSW